VCEKLCRKPAERVRTSSDILDILKGTGTRHKNGIKVVCFERSRLGDGSPTSFHKIVNSLFISIGFELITS
jgi:hypothetical protein